MNLHRLVRGSINAINKNQPIPWLAYQGPINDRTTGITTPTYWPAVNIWSQIQPVPTDELKHLENLNIQGVLRRVYMKGAVASAVRADGVGGDLLAFPETAGNPLRFWLVMQVPEQWPDWCSVVVRLQNDLNDVWTSDSVLVTADSLKTIDD